MTHWQISRYLVLTGMTLLFLIHGFGIIHLPLLDRLERAFYDFKVRQTTLDISDPRLVIVDIDDKSMAALGPWPWPRDRLANLVDTLFEHYRIGVLGIDLVFSEVDSASGLAQLESLAKGPLSQDPLFLAELNKLRPLLDRDRIFAQSLRDRPVTLGYRFRKSSLPGLADTGVLPAPIITLRELGYDDIHSIKAFGYNANISPIQEAATGAGFIDNPVLDLDGVVRRFPLLQLYNGALYQSLPLGIIRTILGDPSWSVGVRAGEGYGNRGANLEWVALGPHKIFVDSQGAILVPYRGKQGSFPQFSAVDILERLPDKKVLDAAVVLIGSSSEEQMGRYMLTPLAERVSSVEIAANIISGLMDANLKKIPSYSPWFEVILMGVFGTFLIVAFPWMVWIWRLIAVILLSVLLMVINIYIWQHWDTHLPWTTMTLLMVLLLLGDLTFELFGVTRKRNLLVARYGRHLPLQVLDNVIRADNLLLSEGEQREMTVIMSSVPNFSQIAKKIHPHDLAIWMQTFLNPLTEVIQQHQGTLDHYHRESLVAFWGAPVVDPRHGRNAMTAVVEMVSRLNKLEDELQIRGWPQLRCHFAIQTGVMTCHMVGSDFRKELTVLGEPAQQVQWLASLAPYYDVPIIVGEQTRLLDADRVFRELDRILPEGGETAITIYEPVGLRQDVSTEMLSRIEAFHKVIKQFRQKEWDLAEEGLKNLVVMDPGDRLYEIYLARIRRFRKTPPPTHWNGVCRPPVG